MESLTGRASNELDRLYGKLEEDVTEYAAICDRAARARADYKLAFATAFLKAEGSMDMRRAEADAKTYVYLREREIAEAIEKSSRAALQGLSDMMGAVRSVMANTRV